jgi:hypothetical protein
VRLQEPDGYECPFYRDRRASPEKPVVFRTDEVMVLLNIRWWPNNPRAYRVGAIAPDVPA